MAAAPSRPAPAPVQSRPAPPPAPVQQPPSAMAPAAPSPGKKFSADYIFLKSLNTEI